MQILSLSLLLPIAYLGILIASMATFSHLYRRRQLVSKLRLAPYFGPHTSRDAYLSLLHLQDSDEKAKVPESVLRAALLARACTDIERIMEVRTRKPALTQLLQRGVVGDEMMQRLTRAEQELELELKDVVNEANALGPAQGNSPPWGSVIFQSAGEMVQNRMLREKLDRIKETTADEKEKWEQVREGARKELMEGGTEEEIQRPLPTQALSKAPPTVSDLPTDRKASVPGSDSDGVLVEKYASEESRPNTSSGTSKKKKKKNKAAAQAQVQQSQTAV